MDRPGVGVSVYIRKDNKILFGLRKGGYAPGTWCAPGGKLEMNEEWIDCAKRETLEETGIEVTNLQMLTVTNDIIAEKNQHWITIVFSADWKSGEPSLREPDKFERWDWFGWQALPKPLFPPTENFIAKKVSPF